MPGRYRRDAASLLVTCIMLKAARRAYCGVGGAAGGRVGGVMVSGSVGPCIQFDTTNTTTAMKAARMRTIRLFTRAYAPIVRVERRRPRSVHSFGAARS